MGKKLRQVADGSDAGFEGMDRVFHTGRKSDHKIAHVGLDRCGLPDLPPILIALQHGAGFGRNILPVFFRQSHAPVQADAGPVDNIAAFPNSAIQIGQSIGGGLP